MNYLIRAAKSPTYDGPMYILTFKPKVHVGDHVIIAFDDGVVYDLLVAPHEGYPCLGCHCGDEGFRCPTTRDYSCIASGRSVTLKFIDRLIEEI